MTQGNIGGPDADFLSRLKKLDNLKAPPRDVMLLYTIISNPGISGKEASQKLGIPHRSGVQLCLRRMYKRNWIEDRRLVARKASPVRLYVLPAGLAFWEEIKP